MERKFYLMKCGHIAQGTLDKKPVCVICVGSNKLAEEVEKEVIKGNEGLEGRKARCSLCGKETDSRWDLPFFEFNKKYSTDTYYCGCRGWD